MASIRLLLLPLSIASSSVDCPSLKGQSFWNGPHSIGSSEFFRSWSGISLQCSRSLSRPPSWICQCKEGSGHSCYGRSRGGEASSKVLGFEEQIPNQAESVVEGAGSVLVSEYKQIPDLDYLQVWGVQGSIVLHIQAQTVCFVNDLMSEDF